MNKRKPIRYDPYNDFYFLLGVQPSATAEELQHAYRQRAKQVHPDLNRDRQDWANEQFQRLNEAYDVLSNTSQRIEYDRLRLTGRRTSTAPGVGNWWEQPHPPGKGGTGPLNGTANRGQTGPLRTPPPPGEGDTVRARPYAADGVRATGTHRAAPGTGPSPRYTPPGTYSKHRPYRSDWQAVLFGLVTGSNRYIIAIVFSLLLSNLLCYLTFFSQFKISPLAEIKPSFEVPSNIILVTLPATVVASKPVVPKCTDGVQITDPMPDAEVVGQLQIRGSATSPGFYAYNVDIDWLGTDPNKSEVFQRFILKTPVQTQVRDDVLVSVANFSNLPTGYYILRLTVTLSNGEQLAPCEVKIHRKLL